MLHEKHGERGALPCNDVSHAGKKKRANRALITLSRGPMVGTWPRGGREGPSVSIFGPLSSVLGEVVCGGAA